MSNIITVITDTNISNIIIVELQKNILKSPDCVIIQGSYMTL